MKTDIKIISTIILLTAILMTSCSEEFIERPPQVDQSEEAFNPEGAVIACYNSLNQWALLNPNGGNLLPGRQFRGQLWMHLIFGEIISDNTYKGGSLGDAPEMLLIAQNDLNPDNQRVREYWNLCYTQITRANWTIENLEATENLTEEERAKLVSEVKFLRAYFYFKLIRAYREFPLITQPLGPGEYKQPKAPRAEIWDQIENDLRDAIPNLPGKSELNLPSQFGRATAGAAKALLAKAFLWRASPGEPERDIARYDSCYQLCKEIIEVDAEYSLTPDFKDIWSIDETGAEYRGGNTNEIMFAILFSETDLGRHNAIYAQATRSRNIENGWGFNCPSEDLLEEFEQEPGDPRIIWTFRFDGDVSADNDTLDTKGYDNPSGMHSRKTWNTSSLDPAGNRFTHNYIVLRYADVLLMGAEAANETGKSADALNWLNQVRDRARNSGTSDPQRIFINYDSSKLEGIETLPIDDKVPDVTTTDQDDLREAIWHERRLEFATEGRRFYDIVRQGRAYEVMNAHYNDGAHQNYGRGFVKGKHEYLPIPQVEIDVSAPLLEQDPSYN